MQKLTRVGLTSILLGVSASWWSGCSSEPTAPGDEPPEELTGAMTVQTTTWGRWADTDGYLLVIDRNPGPPINPHDSVTVDGLLVGQHEVELTRVGNHCTVQGSNPRLVSVGLGPLTTSFRVDCTGPELMLTLVSGDGQAAKPGEALAEPLVVQVTDTSGVGVGGVDVRWEILAGDATLAESFPPEPIGPLLEMSALTDAEGMTRAPLMPLGFETIEVAASVSGMQGSPVTFNADATDAGATLAVVSGTAQPAQAGRELDEPFVVLVSDSRGEPAAHVRVVWCVESGDGDLGRDELGGRVRSDTIRTDDDGRAQVSLTPTWFGPVEASASAVGVNGSPLSFTTDAGDPDATLRVVSGGAQEGKWGEPLDERFVVGAADGLGNAAGNVRVVWRTVDGDGGFLEAQADPAAEEASVYTNAEGVAEVSFSPGALGAITADAELAGTDATATFTLDVDVLVIHYYYPFWGWGPAFDDVSLGMVPLGTSIEWVNHVSGARIVSTSHPLNGSAFDSGFLAGGGRFEFVPDVVGTWEYMDLELGTTGTLTVY